MHHVRHDVNAHVRVLVLAAVAWSYCSIGKEMWMLTYQTTLARYAAADMPIYAWKCMHMPYSSCAVT